jgi:hypothetical protein
MTKIKLSDLNEQERNQLIQEVDGDNAGCGMVYIGTYYALAYRPLKDIVTGDCVGTELFIKKSQEDSTFYSIWQPLDNVKVYSEPKFFDSNKEPFKNRLEASVKDEIARIKKYDQQIDDKIALIAKEKSDREKAIREHTESIRLKQLSIDSTMKSICPKSKSMVEINRERLLSEKSEVETQSNTSQSGDPLRWMRPNRPLKWSEVVSGTWPPVPSDVKSDVEKGRWANDVIIDKKFERPVGYGERNPRIENVVKIPKLVSPSNPRYLTLNERQWKND